MDCRILSETPGRMRVKTWYPRMKVRDADILEYYLSAIDGVTHVTVHERTGNVVICYRRGRRAIIDALARYQGPTEELDERTPVTETRVVTAGMRRRRST